MNRGPASLGFHGILGCVAPSAHSSPLTVHPSGSSWQVFPVPFGSGLLSPVFSQEHLSSGRGREPPKWQRPESEKVPMVPVAILSQDSFFGASVSLVRPLRDDL